MSAKSTAMLQQVLAMKVGGNGMQFLFPRDHASDIGLHEKIIVSSIERDRAATIARRAYRNHLLHLSRNNRR